MGTTAAATDRAPGETRPRYEVAIHRVEGGRAAQTRPQGWTPSCDGRIDS